MRGMGIRSDVIRTVNLFRGPVVRARSEHTSLQGLLNIYNKTLNLTAKYDAAANICEGILDGSFNSGHKNSNALQRLPNALVLRLCETMAGKKKAGEMFGSGAEFDIVSEFAKRMDEGAFGEGDLGAKDAFSMVVSKLDDRRAYNFIFDRIQSGGQRLVMGMINNYPETHERLISDLLNVIDQALFRRAKTIALIGDMVNTSSMIPEKLLLEIYSSLRCFLNDTSEKELINSREIESGTQENWKAAYESSTLEETFGYSLIINTKKLLTTIGLKITDEDMRRQIGNDVLAAPEESFTETNTYSTRVG